MQWISGGQDDSFAREIRTFSCRGDGQRTSVVAELAQQEGIDDARFATRVSQE
jgi:hypothetical protein